MSALNLTATWRDLQLINADIGIDSVFNTPKTGLLTVFYTDAVIIYSNTKGFDGIYSYLSLKTLIESKTQYLKQKVDAKQKKSNSDC